MIKIVIKKSNGNFSIEAKGHANSAPIGSDLVCAAVSAVLVGGANAIKNPSNFNFKIDEGYTLIESKTPVSKEDEIVLQTIECQIKSIIEENDDFVQLFYK